MAPTTQEIINSVPPAAQYELAPAERAGETETETEPQPAAAPAPVRFDHRCRMRAASPRAYLLYKQIEVAFCALLLLVLFPIMAVIAIAIRLDSPGPILFTQVRVGKNGRLFRVYKFRSMVADAEHRRSELDRHNERTGPVFKMRRDPRTTRVGRVIRKLSLDELPQLLNVMQGDMRLVGPRPALPSEVMRYTLADEKRFAVAPGLTGLWQVSGRANLSFEEGIALDLYYIQNHSVAMDLRILAQTVPAVLKGHGAY